MPLLKIPKKTFMGVFVTFKQNWIKCKPVAGVFRYAGHHGHSSHASMPEMKCEQNTFDLKLSSSFRAWAGFKFLPSEMLQKFQVKLFHHDLGIAEKNYSELSKIMMVTLVSRWLFYSEVAGRRGPKIWTWMPPSSSGGQPGRLNWNRNSESAEKEF